MLQIQLSPSTSTSLRTCTTIVLLPCSHTCPSNTHAREVVDIGHVDGSQPKQLHPPFRNPEGRKEFYNQTEDIIGAHSSTLRLEFFRPNLRKEYHDPLRNGDIFGAKAGSLKKGIQTKRITNPLDKAYQYPGATESIKSVSGIATNKLRVVSPPPANERLNLSSTVKINPSTIIERRPEETEGNVQVPPSAKPSEEASPHTKHILSQTATRHLAELAKIPSIPEQMTKGTSADFVTNRAYFYDVPVGDDNPEPPIAGSRLGYENMRYSSTMNRPTKKYE